MLLQVSRDAKLPVMFYIHGGSFVSGSAYDFQPGFLLEEDIVLVVPQYRLGVLGRHREYFPAPQKNIN